MKRAHFKTCIGAAGIVAATMGSLPGTAAAQTINDYYLIGIDSTSGEMTRYKFSDSTLETIGTVQDLSNNTLTGIEASAYIPRSSNILGFWTDPSDSLTKLVYINTKTATAIPFGADLGEGKITGAVAAPSAPLTAPGGTVKTSLGDIMQHQVYAIQEVPPVDFDITDNQVVPTEPFAAKVTVLGSSITSGGAYDIPVTVKFIVDGVTFEPFGSQTQAVAGNVNDGSNPRTYVFPNTFDPGSTISVVTRSWDLTYIYYNTVYAITGVLSLLDTDWDESLEVDSTQNSPQVITLRNGDAVPSIPGFLDQASLAVFIADYIDSDTDTVVLEQNQAIYLFELGTTDLSSSAADFQDLVVLVTLAQTPGELTPDETSAPARLITVNPTNGTKQHQMNLSRVYDSLAGISSLMFFATSGTELYAIDPVAKTETLVGSLAASNDINALEFANTELYRHSMTTDHIRLLDTVTGSPTGPEINIGVQDLGTMIFMRTADEPSPEVLYD